jgi:hypothetical protein
LFMVGKNPSLCLSPTIAWVFFLLSKFNNSRCWELFNYGAKKLELLLGSKIGFVY